MILPLSVRIKLKSVDHYLRCVATLKEFGIQCNVGAENVYELDLRRLKSKEWKHKGYIYISCNRNLQVFMSKSVVQYATEMTRKEFIKWYKSLMKVT